MWPRPLGTMGMGSEIGAELSWGSRAAPFYIFFSNFRIFNVSLTLIAQPLQTNKIGAVHHTYDQLSPALHHLVLPLWALVALIQLCKNPIGTADDVSELFCFL